MATSVWKRPSGHALLRPSTAKLVRVKHARGHPTVRLQHELHVTPHGQDQNVENPLSLAVREALLGRPTLRMATRLRRVYAASPVGHERGVEGQEDEPVGGDPAIDLGTDDRSE